MAIQVIWFWFYILFSGVDRSLFQKKLKSLLKSHHSYPEVIKMSAIYQNILNSCYMWLFSWYAGYRWLPWRTTAKDREFWEVERKIIEKIERNLGHILGTIFDRNFSYCFQAKIVGKLYCLLALPMLVDKIWWVNCNKQHWEGEKIGKIKKEKNRI